MAIEIIIFDLYDTLIEIGEKLNPYEKMFNYLGKTKSEIKTIKNQILTNNYENVEELTQRLDIKIGEQLVGEISKMIDLEVKSTFIYDESLPTLNRLSQNYRLFCLSNLSTPYKSPYFKLGLDKIIEKEFFSCDIGNKKPNPTFFQRVLDYAKVSNKESLMIGNSLHSDYNGAVSCGINAVLKDQPLDIIMSRIGV